MQISRTGPGYFCYYKLTNYKITTYVRYYNKKAPKYNLRQNYLFL